MTNKSITRYILIILGFLFLTVLGWYTYSYVLRDQPTQESVPFDGQRAYEDVKTQVAFGPRIPQTQGHDQVQAWIRKELESADWQVEIQTSEA